MCMRVKVYVCAYACVCMSDRGCIYIYIYVRVSVCVRESGNLLSFLLRCGTRPYERGTQ